MSHKRNTVGLREAALQKREVTREKAENAIRELIKAKRPINYHSVSEVGQISLAWLYKDTEMRTRISQLRAQEIPKKSLEKKRMSDPSKNALIEAQRERIKELESEVSELRKQVQTLLSRLVLNK